MGYKIKMEFKEILWAFVNMIKWYWTGSKGGSPRKQESLDQLSNYHLFSTTLYDGVSYQTFVLKQRESKK